MHLASPQSSCTMWQGKEILSPCYGCMGFLNLWGKGFELLEHRPGQGEGHLSPTDPSMEHGPFQRLAALLSRNPERFQASGTAWNPEPLPPANYTCPTPSIKAWHPWSVSRGRPGAPPLRTQQILSSGDGGTPWSKQVPRAASDNFIVCTHLPGRP